MPTDKRKFNGTICVKVGTVRTRIECCPDTNYGGEAGIVRVRINRQVLSAEGKPLLFDRKRLANLIANTLFDVADDILTCPNIPKGSRISYTVWNRDKTNPVLLGGVTGSEPILDYNGIWQVYVIAYDNCGFVPCHKLITKGKTHAK